MAASVNSELLCCPVHRQPLDDRDPACLRCAAGGDTYPILDGIPILLPDPAERQRVAQTDWAAAPAIGPGGSGIDFYNQTRDHDQYCRSELESVRPQLQRWFAERRCAGAVLEIGSGKGALQGLGNAEGERYVALDYSFTALRRYVDARHARVCGTAERLPFPDATFSFVFTIAALEHVPGADLAMGEIERVLKPGGVAFLMPAWHCTQYNCEGIPVRPYGDLTVRQKLVKLSLPLRRRPWAKALATLPGRVARRAAWAMTGRGPTRFRFRRLRPDYQHFWLSDSDAAARLDSHEGCLYFHSRGYRVLHPGGGGGGAAALRQLLLRHAGVVVRKPPAAA